MNGTVVVAIWMRARRVSAPRYFAQCAASRRAWALSAATSSVLPRSTDGRCGGAGAVTVVELVKANSASEGDRDEPNSRVGGIPPISLAGKKHDLHPHVMRLGAVALRLLSRQLWKRRTNGNGAPRRTPRLVPKMIGLAAVDAGGGSQFDHRRQHFSPYAFQIGRLKTCAALISTFSSCHSTTGGWKILTWRAGAIRTSSCFVS